MERLTRDWLFGLLKYKNEYKTEWNSNWKEKILHVNDCGSVKLLVRGCHGCKKFMQAQREAEVRGRNPWRLPDRQITSGSGKHLKIVGGWRTLLNIMFFLFIFGDGARGNLCHIMKEEGCEQSYSRRERKANGWPKTFHILKYKITVKCWKQ